MRCPVCEEDILLGQEVQRIPAPQRVAPGQKTGIPGLYPHENYEHDPEEIVHYPQCCMGFFSPEDNPYIYDAIVCEVRDKFEENIREEIRDELRGDLENIRRQLGRTGTEFKYCEECWSELEDAEDPLCPWCGQFDSVMQKLAEEVPTYFCMRCQKWWQDREQEGVAA